MLNDRVVRFPMLGSLKRAPLGVLSELFLWHVKGPQLLRKVEVATKGRTHKRLSLAGVWCTLAKLEERRRGTPINFEKITSVSSILGAYFSRPNFIHGGTP